MKPETFDALTKIPATPHSRRRALQKILGILGGGSVAALLPQQVLAADKKHHHRHTKTHRHKTTTIPPTTGGTVIAGHGDHSIIAGPRGSKPPQ